jgi:hypothetical protein
MRLSVSHDRHARRKTFHNAEFSYAEVSGLSQKVSFFRYQMSDKGAAMKAFSVHMPVLWMGSGAVSGL